MTTNYIAARDSMFALIKATADLFDVKPRIEYPLQVSKDKPNPSNVWLRASTQIVDEGVSAISTCSNEIGKKLYTSYGLVIVEFYIPKTEPQGHKALMWATQLRNAFRNASSADGVIYRKARVNDGIPNEDSFFRLNVIANFEFDEIK
ncbi:TPA: hypothetical protein NNQ18_004706 [Salmonella enterica]|nr:hypothetical protein [Salmonella enterica]HCH8414885.1 hypothetical protein [Salmonella enterica]HCH8780813.1 hypothetical protein [Salmonella enterica]HCH9056088.1 hypothetical protein [Salmonella enterica]